MRWAVIGGALALTAVAIGGSASAAVSVFGDSFAAVCSRYARDGRFDPAALETCTVALGEAPLSRHDLAATYVNRGTMQLHRRDWPAALRDFDQAIGMDATLGEARVNRGAAFIGLGKPKEALAELDAGLQLGSEEPEKAWFNRALAHEALDDVKSAYFDFLKASELAPTWAEPRQELARYTVSRR